MTRKPPRELEAFDLFAQIEMMMRIAQDTKKEFFFKKEIEMWFWVNRGMPFEVSEAYGPFQTFLEALMAATEPYIKPSV